jgi:hypothetical protein
MARNQNKNGNRDASGEVDRYRLALSEQEERRVSDPPASSRAWTTRSRAESTPIPTISSAAWPSSC